MQPLSPPDKIPEFEPGSKVSATLAAACTRRADYLKYIYALEMAQRHTNKLGTNMTAHNITAHNILSHTRFCATKYCAPLSELHFHIIVGVVFRPLTQLQPRLLLLLLLAGILPRPALPTTARPTAARPTAARSIAVDLAVCGGV